jgi:quercetin dioxygenase-like cupin family protein
MTSTPHPADHEPLDLHRAGSELLDQARSQSNGHASRLLVGGSAQRAVLMALTEGAELGEHESPAAATFQVVIGSARLYAAGGASWTVRAGEVVAIPEDRHGAQALEDCVILLTVALG